MGVYSGWGSSFLNSVGKFILTECLLYDFLVSCGGVVFLERRRKLNNKYIHSLLKHSNVNNVHYYRIWSI
jgi:hypothetical protein